MQGVWSNRGAVLAFAAVGFFCGCGHRGNRGVKAPDRAQTLNLAGTWEGLTSATARDDNGPGDARVERQTLLVRQDGDRIVGDYLIESSVQSGDGRPFPCSGEPRATTVVHTSFRGQVAADRIDLQELGELDAEGPCRPVYFSPSVLNGTLSGGALTLRGPSGVVQLYRTSASQVAGPSGQNWSKTLAFPALSPTAAAPMNVGGVWHWKAVSTSPGGDKRLEGEDWHLEQRGADLRGHYDRTLVQDASEGTTYRCNNQSRIRVITRFDVSGTVQGSRVLLIERGFRVLEGGACDSGERRLDLYEGEAQGTKLHLRFGTGAQVLERAP